MWCLHCQGRQTCSAWFALKNMVGLIPASIRLATHCQRLPCCTRPHLTPPHCFPYLQVLLVLQAIRAKEEQLSNQRHVLETLTGLEDQVGGT